MKILDFLKSNLTTSDECFLLDLPMENLHLNDWFVSNAICKHSEDSFLSSVQRDPIKTLPIRNRPDYAIIKLKMFQAFQCWLSSVSITELSRLKNMPDSTLIIDKDNTKTIINSLMLQETDWMTLIRFAQANDALLR